METNNYVPEIYIGDNGNWFINGVDTGQPSRGPQGIQGPKGDIGEIDDLTPTYSVADEFSELVSGEKVSEAFGKLAKAVGVLLSHIATKATDSIMGHVKLSDSSSVMEKGTYALDAVEKNSEVPGTLATQILEQNIKLNSFEYKELQFIPGTNAVGNGAVKNNHQVSASFEFSLNSDFQDNKKIATLPYSSKHSVYGVAWTVNNDAVSVYTAGSALYMQSKIKIPAGTAIRGGIDYFTE